MSSKKKAYQELFKLLGKKLSSSICNDFIVDNDPEMYQLLEEAGAYNLNMTLEEFRNSPEYEDYKPRLSNDKKRIYTEDFTILGIIKRKELHL